MRSILSSSDPERVCVTCGQPTRARFDGPCMFEYEADGETKRCGFFKGEDGGRDPFTDRPEHNHSDFAGADHVLMGGPCMCGHRKHGKTCRPCLRNAHSYGLIDFEAAFKATHPYRAATITLDHEAIEGDLYEPPLPDRG